MSQMMSILTDQPESSSFFLLSEEQLKNDIRIIENNMFLTEIILLFLYIKNLFFIMKLYFPFVNNN